MIFFAWLAAGESRSSSAPLPVGGAAHRITTSSASQAAADADAGLTGSPLAYTSAGSQPYPNPGLTLAESAEAGASGLRRTSRSFRRSSSYVFEGPGSNRGRGFFIRDSPSAESLGRSQGGPEGVSLGRNQAGPEGGHAPLASAVHGADAQGLVPEVAEGVGNPNTNPSLSPGVLRTVTERSESLLLDEGGAGAAPSARNGVEQHGGASSLTLNGEAPHEGTALLMANGTSGQGFENGKAHAGGPGGGPGPGVAAKGTTAGAAQVSAASEEFSEKRQVPPGKLAVLLLLFAGGAPLSVPLHGAPR